MRQRNQRNHGQSQGERQISNWAIDNGNKVRLDEWFVVAASEHLVGMVTHVKSRSWKCSERERKREERVRRVSVHAVIHLH